MRRTRSLRGLGFVVVGVMACSFVHAEEKAPILNRSIYMPVEFQLCEHLGSAIFYENDRPTSTMPAERIFQFTYYPNLAVILPERVPIRVEGTYVDDEEPFVAKLAVTVNGVHSARRFRSANTKQQLEKRLHKIDVRLKPRTLMLTCQRFCKRSASALTTEP